MAEFKCLSFLLMCPALFCLCQCQDDGVSVTNRLDQFEEVLLDNKVDILRVEQKVIHMVDVAKSSLKAELKETILDLVKNTMAEILKGESLPDMIKSNVVSEMQHLKHEYHHIKKQLHHVSKSLELLNETNVVQKSVQETSQIGNPENSSDICHKDKQRLEMELKKCDIYTADLETNIKALNETYQSQISELKTSLSVPVCASTTVNVTSSSSSAVPTSSVATSSVATPRPGEKRSRILIAPIWTGHTHYFRQLNIQSNQLTTYHHFARKYFNCLAYIAKTNTLLIGSNQPYSIFASILDTNQVTELRRNIRTLGMAVDEDRDIVFISRLTPRHSISRMSTQGEDLTVIAELDMFRKSPRQITLDTKTKRIYACVYYALFTVTYDGQDMKTLATGSFLHAVFFDQPTGVLYYNSDRKLMKMTVNDTMSTEVATMDARPINMILYRGTIYYAGIDPTLVGAVRMSSNTAYTLQPISMTGVGQIHICLIP